MLMAAMLTRLSELSGRRRRRPRRSSSQHKKKDGNCFVDFVVAVVLGGAATAIRSALCSLEGRTGGKKMFDGSSVPSRQHEMRC